MTDIYTHTLASGQILAVSIEATLGELLMAGLFLVLLAIGSMEFIFRLVYRK